MNKPDPVWKLSMFSRAMLDFNIMLDSEHVGPFFRNIETIKDLHEEQKRLAFRINLFYAITFIGALLVLSGPLPSNTKISIGGIELPISSMPQQVISIMMAVSYSMFGTLFASFTILASMNNTILRKEGLEGHHFIGARFDASNLWGTLITPRTIGYRSPKRHRFIAYAILLVSVLSVVAHAVVIAIATFLSFWAAFKNGAWILALLGGFSAVIVTITIATIAMAILLPLPFRADEGELPADEAAP